MRRSLLPLLCSVALLAAACEGGAPPAPEATPEPEGGRPLPAPTAVLSLGEPDEEGRYRIAPVSAEVETGVPYEFTLLTRCGLDLLVDFNGSLWDAVDPAGNRKQGPPPGFEEPRDRGTMVLVNQELAEYESSQGEMVRFIRHPGAKKIKPCPAG